MDGFIRGGFGEMGLKRSSKFFIGVGVTVVGCGVALFLFHQSILQKSLRSIAADYGVELKFSLKSLSWNKVRLTNIVANKSEVSKIDVRFSGLDVVGVSAHVKELNLDELMLMGTDSSSATSENEEGKRSLYDQCRDSLGIPFSISVESVVYKGSERPLLIDLEGKDHQIKVSVRGKVGALRVPDLGGFDSAEVKAEVLVSCRQEGVIELRYDDVLFSARGVELKTHGLREATFDLAMPKSAVSLVVGQPLDATVSSKLELSGLYQGESIHLVVGELQSKVRLGGDFWQVLKDISLELSNISVDMEQRLLVEKALLDLHTEKGDLLQSKGSFLLEGASIQGSTENELIGSFQLEGDLVLKKGEYRSQFKLGKGKGTELLRGTVLYKPEVGVTELHLPGQTLKLGTELQLAELSPILKEYIKDASGELYLKGKVRLSEEKDSIDMIVRGSDLDLKSDSVEILGQQFEHQITSLPDFKSPDNQRIFIKKISMGKTFKDLEIKYQVVDLSQIDVRSFAVNFEGAQINTGSFSVFPQVKRFSKLESVVEKLAVQTMLRLFYDDSVIATGDLSGKAQFDMKEGVPVIKKGILKSNGTGLIQLRPEGSQPPDPKEIPTDPTRILKNYLYDFKYTNIEVEVSTNPVFDMEMTMRIEGRNPGYLDGKPLKLSINLDMNLKDMVMSALMTYDIPSALKKKLLKIGK